MSDFPTPCRNEFERLSQEDPEFLIYWVTSGELASYDLTFAAEELGQVPASLQVLLDLMEHGSSIVREGALLGLQSLRSQINDVIEQHAETDASPGVQSVAKALTHRT